MTPKKYCESHDVIAYYSGWGGVEIHGVEDEGCETYVYFKASAWYGKKTYHRCKVHFSQKGHAYFRCGRGMIYLSECIKT